MQLSQVPSKFNIPFASSAGGGYIRTVPQASQIGITNGAASLTDGFPPVCFLPIGSGGVPPYGQDMNGILNQITLWNQWNSAGGLCLFDSVFSAAIGGYPKGALLASSTSGQFWLNTVDNNTTNPDSSGTNWAGFNQTSIPHNCVDTASSANTITVTSANVTPIISTVTTGMLFIVTKGSVSSTGAITATIAGQAGSVIWADSSSLVSGDWPASATALLKWNGTNYLILSVMGPSVFARSMTSLVNLVQQVVNTRVVMQGIIANSLTVTAWTPANYVKLSAASILIVFLNVPSYTSVGGSNPYGNGAGLMKLTIGGVTQTVISANNQSQQGVGNSTLIGIFTGVPAGSNAMLLQYFDSANQWQTTFCPSNTDNAEYPSSTSGTLVIGELGL